MTFDPNLPVPADDQPAAAAIAQEPTAAGQRAVDSVFSLADYVDQYVLENDVTSQYITWLRRSVVDLETFAVRRLMLTDLTDNLVNAWLTHLNTNTKLNPKTIKNRRACVLALWRHAFMAERVDTEPRRVKKIKVASTIPMAWSADDMLRLLAATELLPGWLDFNGIKQSDFWRAFVLVAYDSGLRLGDILSLKLSDIRDGGKICLVQHKTLRGHVVQIRPQTAEACKALFPPNDPKRKDIIFWWPINDRQFFKRLRSLIDLAGLSADHGMTRRLRRTSASMAESVTPGTAWQLLGHTTPELANKHYIDPVVAGRKPVMPPPINKPNEPSDDGEGSLD